MPEVVTQQVRLAALRIDGGTQPRTVISEETVAAYTEHMRALVPAFPPVVVFFDGVDYWLADGFHRYHAAQRAERDSVFAEIRSGTKRDAVLYGICANQTHGLPRTNADKRKAVTALLADDEWRQWSDREISRRVGVSADLVGDTRRALAPVSVGERQIDQPRKVERGGTVYEQKTENINKGRDRTRAGVAQRRQDISDMAGRGFTTRQIAAAIGVAERGVAEIARTEGIVIHADRVVGKTQRHDANRIVGQMVMDAENLTADVNLIDFSQVDPSQLAPWIHSLNVSRKSLGAFIRRLEEEQKKHGQAA